MAKRNMDDTMELLNLDDTMEMLNLEEEKGFGYYFDDTEEEDDYYEGEVRAAKGYVKAEPLPENTVSDEAGEKCEAEGYEGEEEEYEEEEYEEEEEEYEEEEYEEEEEEYEEEEYQGEDDEEDDEEYEYDEEDDYGLLALLGGIRRKRQLQNQRDVRQRRGIVYHIKNMDVIDRVVAVTGSLILVVALVLGGVYMNAQTVLAQVASFEDVGMQMDGITVIGESGLLAMSDAQNAKALEQAAAESVVEEVEYEEKELYEKGSIEVEMHLSSMQKDLKIKFINKSTGKLIPSVPFEVDIETSNGKSYMLIDEDMDGIIYQTEVAPGKCSVAMNEVEDAEEYFISTEKMTVNIKDKIEYKKVDVADEVKTEAEVNAAVEDTKRQTQAESELQDTVDFVESSKNPVEEVVPEVESGEYEEVPKENITDPNTLASASYFYKFAAPTDNGGAEQAGTDASQENGTVDASAGQANVASQSGTTQEGTGDTTAGQEASTQTADTSQGENTQSAVNVTLSQTALSMKVGENYTLQAVTAPEGNGVTWVSDNAAVATVQDGVITAVAVGNANVTATTATGNSAVCAVTVAENTADGITITISQTTAKVYVGKTVQIGAAVAGADDKAVVWRSDNEAVATIAQDGTITGISIGTAKIEAVANADQNVKAVCEVTVKDSPQTDTETKLKDNDGNQLYVVDSEGNFREAVYADYYTAEKFYKKTQVENAETTKEESAEGEFKYTGWQTIDGKTYYFDANGNKVTGEQVIQGARYTFDSEGALSTAAGNMGIDVSKWNGQIDWNAVKNSGVSYVIIRCGYRGSTTGALIEDPNFRANIQGASSAGLKVGIYFFTQAVNEVEAVEEASMVAGLISGYHISYPVFLDVEPSGGRADGISAETRTAVCKAFCQTIQNSGYTAGIYANSTWLREKINTASLTDYKIWLAQYAATPTYTSTRYDLWQYSAKGKVAGISGDTDLNISYLGY